MMRYKDENLISRNRVNEVFVSEDVGEISATLVAIALNDSSWRWAQNRCLEFLNHDNFEIRGVAATCLGHIARIHGQLDKDKVMPALRERLKDKAISGRIEDAIADIGMFLSNRRKW